MNSSMELNQTHTHLTGHNQRTKYKPTHKNVYQYCEKSNQTMANTSIVARQKDK